MVIIIAFFVLACMLMPLGAVINAHNAKVKRRQNIEDMKEAILRATDNLPHVQAIAKEALEAWPDTYHMYGAQQAEHRRT